LTGETKTTGKTSLYSSEYIIFDLHPIPPPQNQTLKLNKALQEKLEEVFKALGYKVRYEKGNFKSGYCLIEDQNIVVINKFFPVESKVNTLMEILRSIDVDSSLLDSSQQKLLVKINQTSLQL
jgi:hypothetical protein